ncbi:hypothetical protein H4R35_005857 [Dimargaris xerosporica]|nr:hypothetical protein H4R35_005857 [Dimargaris xerosporica]
MSTSGSRLRSYTKSISFGLEHPEVVKWLHRLWGLYEAGPRRAQACPEWRVLQCYGGVYRRAHQTQQLLLRLYFDFPDFPTLLCYAIIYDPRQSLGRQLDTRAWAMLLRSPYHSLLVLIDPQNESLMAATQAFLINYLPFNNLGCPDSVR